MKHIHVSCFFTANNFQSLLYYSIKGKVTLMLYTFDWMNCCFKNNDYQTLYIITVNSIGHTFTIDSCQIWDILQRENNERVRLSLQWRHNERDGVSNHQPHESIVYSTVYSRRRSKNHQSSAPLVFVRRIHRWPVNSPHKGPVTRKMLPFDDVIMWQGMIKTVIMR